MAIRIFTLIVLICFTAPLEAQKKNPYNKVHGDVRLDVIRHAQVWKPVDVAQMDIKAGPQGKGAFAEGSEVRCAYKEEKLVGTPKFNCVIEPEDEVRVKYGANNGEVYAEVAATRLLWALGFGADRIYPVTVVCSGCPDDPIRMVKKTTGTITFSPAIIERKMEGDPVELSKDSGWTWVELTFVDEAAGGATLAQRDALRLLAAMIQHTDSKAQQQRLLCLDRSMGLSGSEDGSCEHPFMIINDLGKTFGTVSTFNGDRKSAVNLKEWVNTRVWKDDSSCVAHMPKSFTGSLENPKISERGRKFLSGLLAQLSDAQLRDLFQVAQFTTRDPNTTVDDWVAAFKKKRDEIASRTCPA
jgi:hypothetical protein